MLHSVPPPSKRPVTKLAAENSWLSRTLADRATLLRLSVIGNICMVIGLFLQPHFIAAQFRAPQRAIILDGAGSFTVSPLVELSSARALHEACSKDALQAILNRNPEGLDRPDQAELWLTKAGREKLQVLIENEKTEFKQKQFYQKIVLTSCDLTPTGPDQFSGNLKGQLIRTGVLNERVHVETLDFDLQLFFIRNPDMLSNRRYPYGVWNFDLKYTR